MVANPVTSAFIATIRACAWVSPDHVQLIVGPALWIKTNEATGAWSFGVNSAGAWLLAADVFALLSASSANADGTIVTAAGDTMVLVPNGSTHAAEMGQPPPPPPPPPA